MAASVAAAGGAAAAVTEPRQRGRILGVTPPVILNSWTYRDLGLEAAMRDGCALGFDGIEIYAGHNSATVGDTFAAARRLAAATGLPVNAVNVSGGVGSEDPARRATAEAEYREVIVQAARAGVGIVNGSAASVIVDRSDWSKNGSAAATGAHYERAAEAYRLLGAEAERVGVMLTLEIHMNTIHDTAAAALRLLQAVGSPAVKVNLDPGNMWGVRRAEDPLEAVRLLGGARIGYVHCKNARRNNGPAPGVDYEPGLEEGDLDYRAIAGALCASGYRGAFCIEYSGRAIPREVAGRDLTFLRSILSDAYGRDAG